MCYSIIIFFFSYCLDKQYNISFICNITLVLNATEKVERKIVPDEIIFTYFLDYTLLSLLADTKFRVLAY